MSLSQQEFTNVGRAMLGRAQNGEVLHITNIVIGSGSAGQPSDLWPLTNLIHQEMTTPISTKRDYGDGTLLVEGSILSTNAPHAFQLREVGVMAHIGSDPDRLYSVSNVFADAPDTIDPAAPTVEVFKIKLIIDRIPSANVIIQIGPSENVVGENIGSDTVGPGWYRDAQGNVLYFKRIVQGPGVIITEAADHSSITVGLPLLTRNLDLYVPLTYPNPPAGALLFPTIMDAHNYLLQFTIPTDKFAQIHVGPGTFTGRLGLWHPNGDQIFISGMPRKDKAITQINYAGVPGSVNVGCNTTGLAVGMFVYLILCDAGWAGLTFITAVASGYVTVAVVKKDSRPVYTTNDHGSGRRMSWLPTTIATPDHGPPWTAQQVLCYTNYAAVANLQFFGGYHALHLLAARTSLQNIVASGGAYVGIAGGTHVVFPEGTPTAHNDIVVCDCDWGFTAGTCLGHNIWVNFTANACGVGASCDVWLTLGAVAGVPSGTGKICFNHCNSGVFAISSNIGVGNVQYSNNDIGFEAAHCGVAWVNGIVPNIPRNNGYDLYAWGMGYVEYNRGGDPTALITTPAPGDPGGNQNSYIWVGG